jgi:hypothetical protein
VRYADQGKRPGIPVIVLSVETITGETGSAAPSQKPGPEFGKRGA